MKKRLIYLFLASSIHLFGQDTIYSVPYPKGIVTNNFHQDGLKYIFNPIDNPDIQVILHKKSIRKIATNKEYAYVNPKISFYESYKEFGYGDSSFVLSSNKNTGKVEYTDIINVPNSTAKQIFESLEGMKQSTTMYQLAHEDKTTYTYQKYIGWFDTKFAGDRYVVTFNLELKFKDGKLKYLYSDFVARFSRMKTKGGASYFGTGSTTNDIITIKDIEKVYATGQWNSDQEGFWATINKNVKESISTINRLSHQINKDKDGW